MLELLLVADESLDYWFNSDRVYGYGFCCFSLCFFTNFGSGSVSWLRGSLTSVVDSFLSRGLPVFVGVDAWQCFKSGHSLVDYWVVSSNPELFSVMLVLFFFGLFFFFFCGWNVYFFCTLFGVGPTFFRYSRKCSNSGNRTKLIGWQAYMSVHCVRKS